MEKKLIRNQLLKNLALTFITFLALLAFFDIFIYKVVSSSLLNSVDAELKLGKTSYEWQLNAASLINSDNDKVALNTSTSENSNYRIVLLKNENEQNMQEPPQKKEDNPQNNLEPNLEEKENQNTKQNSNTGTRTEKEKKEKRQEIIDNSGIDEKNTKKVQEYIDKLNTINPRLIIIKRNSDGEITNAEEIGTLYTTYQDNLTFDSSNLDNIYSLEVEGFNYRGLNFSVDSDDVNYVQLLINIDSEKKSINDVIKTLTIGSGLILLISLIASYFLSKKTLKPIIESYEKETEFVQNASHELRTPLTIIQAKQELLLQEPNSKIIDKSEDISVSLQETRRLTKLIKELMILAKSDASRYEINKEKTNVDELIENLLTPYIELYNEQNREIKLDLNYKKEFNLDKDKISELLIILLDNAIKYTKENDEITVKTYEENKKLIIEVQDTGIGISNEAIGKIFDRFYREDKSHSRKIGGNGLGLSIAQIIVSSHSGTIKALHNKPKGTIFQIKL